MFLQFLFQISVIVLSCWITLAASSLSFLQAKPGCQQKCGDVNIPYPFGVISASGRRDCSINGSAESHGFSIKCDTTYNPPKPFLASATGDNRQILTGRGYLGSQLVVDTEILSISESEIRLKALQTISCYDKSGALVTVSTSLSLLFDFVHSPFSFSHTKNRVFAVGCDTNAVIVTGVDNNYSKNYTSQCLSKCKSMENVFDVADSCTGNGCCEMSFPMGQKWFAGLAVADKNHTEVWSFNPCGYMFMAEKEYYKFNAETDLLDHRGNKSLVYGEGRNKDKPLSIVLDWAIGNETCAEAQKNSNTFACHQNYNSYCIDSDNGYGYRCSCNSGYEGNPYISPGCQDVNECEDERTNPCEGICTNIVGSYSCSCPEGSYGDGRKDGRGCTLNNKEHPIIKAMIGVCVALFSLAIGVAWILLSLKKNNLTKLKKKFFQQNGGFLLQQKIGTYENGIESTQILTAKELELATKNYAKSQILGRGAYGTVYKGTLADGRIVAIKKSHVAVQSQIEQFINEVIILTQIHHRNVVKLLGCCLETEVPLLVYEYVSNGTLFEHIHHKVDGLSSISWEGRLRIAAGTAGALAYLHSAAAIPVIHRDIKSTNILLDESFTAKISDFGASRLVPLDQTEINTAVQGTIGYLDPEYFHTSQLTEKSDVYSFGVVLVELLTGEKPLCLERPPDKQNLTAYFISSLRDGGVFHLLDALVEKEAKQEQVVIAAELAKRCLYMTGEERPKMKEVAAILESLKRRVETQISEIDCPPTHKQEITNVLEPHDLYAVPLSASSYSFEHDMIVPMHMPR